jgi:hypothetical protein
VFVIILHFKNQFSQANIIRPQHSAVNHGNSKLMMGHHFRNECFVGSIGLWLIATSSTHDNAERCYARPSKEELVALHEPPRIWA